MFRNSTSDRRTRFARTVLGAAVLSSGIGVLFVGPRVEAETAASLQLTAVQCPEGTALPTAATVATSEIPSSCRPIPGLGFVLPGGTQVTGSNGVASAPVIAGTFTIAPVASGPNAGGLAQLRCNGDVTSDTDATETVTYEIGAGTSNCVAYYVGTPGLSVTKTGPATAAPGTTVRYVITISNNGQGTVFNAMIDDVASGLGTPTIVSQPQYLIDAGRACTAFPCSLWFINPGAVKTFEVTYVVPPCLPPGTITNTASVSGSNITTATGVATTTNTGCTSVTTGPAPTSTTTTSSTTTTAPVGGVTTTIAGTATTTIASATTTTTAAPAATTTTSGAASATTTIAQVGVTAAPTATTAPAPAATTAGAAPAASPGAGAPAAGAAATTTAVAGSGTAAVGGVTVTIAPAPIAKVAGEQITNTEPIAFTGPRASVLTALAAGILVVLGLMLIVSAQMPALGRRRS